MCPRAPLYIYCQGSLTEIHRNEFDASNLELIKGINFARNLLDS